MRVKLTTRYLPLTRDLEDYVQRRLDFAVGSRYDQVRRISVTLSDVNGPRGGVDKRCQIIVKISGQPDLVVEDTQADLTVAIDRAASRVSRTLARRISRIRYRPSRARITPLLEQAAQERYARAVGE